MDANQVVQKILAQGQAEADKIRAEADEKIKEIKAAGEEELSKYRHQTEQMAKTKTEDKKATVLASARIAITKELTQVKRNLLNTTIEKAGRKIGRLDSKEYLSIMESLFLRAVKTGSEEVVIGKNEKHIDENFVRNINQKLSPKGNLHISGDRADIEAGFMLRQNRIQVNAALDVLLKAAAEELESRLAAQLFG